MSICQSCEKDIKEEEEAKFESFLCDKCGSAFHNNCTGVRKTDVKARKTSNSLRILCPFCVTTTDESIEKKIEELTLVVYKTDLSCQKQNETIASNNSIMGKMANSLVDLVKKVNLLTEKINSFGPNATTSARVTPDNKSYANVASSKPVKPAVVIKPKNKQHSKKTMEEIVKTVDKKSVNVCSTRNARNGGVILQCSNATETMKVKQIVHEKLGDEYEVLLPAVKDPRLRITNIDSQIADESVIEELKLNNENIRDIEMKLVAVISKKFRGTTTKEAIVEVKSTVYKKLLEIGELNLPWRECRIIEHLYLKRCFKCCGFSHIAGQCKQTTQSCSKCAGNHKLDDCKSKKLCCVNCKAANESSKMNLKTNHHAYSKECSILQRRLVVLRNKIEYNPAE